MSLTQKLGKRERYAKVSICLEGDKGQPLQNLWTFELKFLNLLIYEDFRSRSSLPVPPARQTGADTYKQARRQGMRKK